MPVPVTIGIVLVLVLIIGFVAYRAAAPQPQAVSRSHTTGMPGGSGAPPPSALLPIDQVHPVQHATPAVPAGTTH